MMNTFIFDINEQNLNDVLQDSQQTPLILTFYSLSDTTSRTFADKLTHLAEQYQGQFMLGKVNCDTEKMLAAQFHLQMLPTTYLFKEAQAIDAFQGILNEEALKQRISIILPKEEEIKFNLALEFLAAEDYQSALPLLKEAWESSQYKNSDIALLYAETYLAIKRIEPALSILNRIPLEDRDTRWQGLITQAELLEKAANTPEIQQLQAEFEKKPSNDTALKLALQLHQHHRNEEALALLFNILKTDLNAANGEVKVQFLAILTAIGINDPLANKYRRLLYSLLY